jgi:hypothetical protein
MLDLLTFRLIMLCRYLCYGGSLVHEGITRFPLLCISEVRKVGHFLRVLRFAPPIKLTAMI